jgi:hypothetical protein
LKKKNYEDDFVVGSVERFVKVKKKGLSTALLEALLCQIPCIVTSQNLNHDVIKHD